MILCKDFLVSCSGAHDFSVAAPRSSTSACNIEMLGRLEDGVRVTHETTIKATTSKENFASACNVVQ